MPVIEFVTQSSRDADNEAANSERLVNCYPEPVGGGLSRFSLKSVLGTVAFSDTGNVFARALASMDGALYAAVGGELFSVNAVGVSASLGAITDSAETSMAGNNGSLAVAAGGGFFVWDGAAMSSPAPGAFSSIGSVETLGHYTIITEKDGRKFQWSALTDPTTWDATHFATTEKRDDKNLRAVAYGGNLLIFKEGSIEIWLLVPGGSGTSAFGFGKVLDTGLKDYSLVTRTDAGVFFVGDDGIAYLTTGQALQAVSTVGVETAISQGSPTECFFYEDEGHKFCVVRFSDRAAWCYDLSTGLWHERASGKDYGAWSARAAAKQNGGWVIANESGRILTLSRVNRDENGHMYRDMWSRTLYMEGAKFRIAEITLQARVGMSNIEDVHKTLLTDAKGNVITNDYGQGISVDETEQAAREPMVIVQVSRDGGMTWGAERVLGLGLLGQFWKRVTARGFGQFERAAFRVRMTEDADAAIYSAVNVVIR